MDVLRIPAGRMARPLGAYLSHTLFFAAGWSVLNGFADTVPVLIAVLLHELGHLIACRLLGVRVRTFRATAAGAVIGYDAALLSYPREMIVAAAGPFVNFLSFLLVLGCHGRAAALFGIASLALALFNLLPHEKLDGGVILSALLSCRFGADAAARFVHIFSAILTVLLWACAVAVQMRCGGNLSLLLVSVYLLMTL
ncbi:MAG: hypothetical protein IJZ08_07625 [Clostridia bacterium]|nr:hypothetical protein [Clostridia bacterium]